MNRPRTDPPFRFTLRVPALVALLLLLALLPYAAMADDGPFTLPSNSGLSGLLEVPNARVMPGDHIRVGYRRADPYRWYFTGVGLWDRLEVSGRITEVSGVPGFQNDLEYGDFKDKAIDFKLKFLKEGKYLPALSLVVMDPHGTRIYPSQALVASKQIYPFDFTVGMGNGRFGDRPLPASGEGFDVEILTDPDDWWKDSRVFAGIQFAPRDWVVLSAEYSPIAYHAQTRDPAQPVHFPEKVPSPFNFGLQVKPLPWAELGLSWQRGDTFGFGFSVDLDMSRPVVPIYEAFYRETPPLAGRSLEERIVAALREAGFRDIGISGEGALLRVEAYNTRYFFAHGAFEAASRALGSVVPESFEHVEVVLTENGIPMVSFSANARALRAYAEGSLPRRKFGQLASARPARDEPPPPRIHSRRRYEGTLVPSLELFINDPAEFISYRFGLEGTLDLFPWKGMDLTGALEYYPLNTVETANEPLSIPVRSDIALYKEEEVGLARLMGDQIFRVGRSALGRFAGGYLETMYAGVDGEAALSLRGGRVYLGALGSWVRKRKPDSVFGLLDEDYHVLLGRVRLNVPEWGVAAELKTGRFLAGDLGAGIILSKFINGYTISAWYTATDTSDFTDSFNRNYHDKGVSITFPLRAFLGRDSRVVFPYRISAWTRDVGQDLDRRRNLFDFLGRNTPLLLDSDRGVSGKMAP